MLWKETHPAIHAIILATTGFSLFCLSDSISKWLTQYYSVPQILAYNSVFAIIFGAIWMLKTRGIKGFITANWRLHLARGISMMLTAFCVVSALAHIPLADFYGIVFLSPLLVSILSSLIFRETIGAARFCALIIGFIGVLIIAGPQFKVMNIGIIFAFSAVIFIIVSLLLMRKIGDRDPLPLYFLYPFICNFILNTPLMLFDHTPVSPDHWLLFIILPLVVMAAMIAIAIGFARAPETAIVAPFHYSQMIWGIAIGLFIFGDIPSLQTLLGAALIIGAGLFVIWREHRRGSVKAKTPEIQL